MLEETYSQAIIIAFNNFRETISRWNDPNVFSKLCALQQDLKKWHRNLVKTKLNSCISSKHPDKLISTKGVIVMAYCFILFVLIYILFFPKVGYLPSKNIVYISCLDSTHCQWSKRIKPC